MHPARKGDEVASDVTQDAAGALLRAAGIHKWFGGLHALDGVSFEIRDGDVIGLVGDNGAGKSTLVKILSGVHPPSEGQLYVRDKPVTLSTPNDAQKLGIETLYQDLALIGSFTVAQNFFLGREEVVSGGLSPLHILRKRAMAADAARALAELNIKIPGLKATKVSRMSGGQRQAVAIARGAFWSRSLLLLDEPTAALGVQESRQVLELILRMRERRLAMVVITHNLEHLWSICTRVVVMRRGRKVADLQREQTNPQEVVGYITGAVAEQGLYA